MSQTLLRAGLYARVSNIERQTGEDRTSIDVQLGESRALALARGWVVAGEYVDDERYRQEGAGALVDPAGWRVDRPAWLRLEADVRAGKVDVIIAWRTDRLARGLKATAVLDDLIAETKVQVALCRENFDKNMLGFNAAISRYEINVIRERTEFGRKARVRRGLRASDKVPFGYCVLKDAAGRTTGYALKDTHLPALREMARLFVAGHSYQVMCERLGLDPDNGRRWLVGKVWRTIHNPFYRGEVVYSPGGAEGRGAYPLPWDAATQKAVAVEARRRASLKRFAPRSSNTLFAGILFCAYCGAPMRSGGVNVTNQGGGSRMYRCARSTNYAQRKSNDDTSTHRHNQITQRAAVGQLQALLGSISEADVDALLASQPQPPQDAGRLAWLTQEKTEAEARLADLDSSLKLKLPDAARLAIASEADRSRAYLSHLQGDLAALADTEPDLDQVRSAMVGLIQDPIAAFVGEPEVVRERLRAAFPRIYVLHGELKFDTLKNPKN